MTAAQRIGMYLYARQALPWQADLIAFAVDGEHAEESLYASDLRELLAENARLRAQDRAGELRVAEAYAAAFRLRPWEEKQMADQAARREQS